MANPAVFAVCLTSLGKSEPQACKEINWGPISKKAKGSTAMSKLFWTQIILVLPHRWALVIFYTHFDKLTILCPILQEVFCQYKFTLSIQYCQRGIMRYTGSRYGDNWWKFEFEFEIIWVWDNEIYKIQDMEITDENLSLLGRVFSQSNINFKLYQSF